MTNGGSPCHEGPKSEVRRPVEKKRAPARKEKPGKPSQTTAR
jgi:hypothetical protein